MISKTNLSVFQIVINCLTFSVYGIIISFQLWKVNDFIPKMEYNINMEIKEKIELEEKYLAKFSERLRELRLEKKLSIMDLSKEIKVGVGSIFRWENKQADIGASQLVVLAKFFDVTTDYLVGLED